MKTYSNLHFVHFFQRHSWKLAAQEQAPINLNKIVKDSMECATSSMHFFSVPRLANTYLHVRNWI